MAGIDAFRERERALEEGFFRGQDQKLLQKLRARATFGELAAALGEKLRVDDPALIEEIRSLGLTQDTGAALLVAPLVQVAWADGVVAKRERDAVLALAASRGIAAGSPAHATIVEWLERRPPDKLFDVALRTIDAGLAVLTPEERAERLRDVEEACRNVARAAGGISALFGLGGEISDEEARLVQTIAEKLGPKRKKSG
jgi:tellurite resistance protein